MVKPTLYLVTTDFDLDMTSKAFDDNKRIWSPEQMIAYRKQKHKGQIYSKDFLGEGGLERRASWLEKDLISLTTCTGS